MDQPKEQASDFLTGFARQRQELLYRTGLVLGSGDSGRASTFDAPTPGQSDGVVAKLSQLLLASLEVLKVAEDEIRDRDAETQTTRAELERVAGYNRSLFDLAPVALLLTTTAGLIQAANRAAATLLKRDIYHLDGQSIPALVPKQAREAFQEQLKLLTVTQGASNWRFIIERHTHFPLTVLAAVEMIPSSIVGANALYWHLSADGPLPEAD